MEDGTRVEKEKEGIERDDLCRRCYQMRGDHVQVLRVSNDPTLPSLPGIVHPQIVYVCPNAIGVFAGDMRKPGQVS